MSIFFWPCNVCTKPPRVIPPPPVGEVLDCPLTFYEESLTSFMPRRLAHVASADPGVDALRVWTTLCCLAMLEKLPHSWVFGDGDIYPPPEEDFTIVDAGRVWVEQCAKAHPALAAALEDGHLALRARQVCAAWRHVDEIRVHELRHTDGITQQMGESQTKRTLTNVYRAFITQHDTCACALLRAGSFCLRLC